MWIELFGTLRLVQGHRSAPVTADVHSVSGKTGVFWLPWNVLSFKFHFFPAQ